MTHRVIGTSADLNSIAPGEIAKSEIRKQVTGHGTSGVRMIHGYINRKPRQIGGVSRSDQQEAVENWCSDHASASIQIASSNSAFCFRIFGVSFLP